MASTLLRQFTRLTISSSPHIPQLQCAVQAIPGSLRHKTTLNQVLRGCRKGQKARRSVSPAMSGRCLARGVAIRVTTASPKKPNSGEKKVGLLGRAKRMEH